MSVARRVARWLLHRLLDATPSINLRFPRVARLVRGIQRRYGLVRRYDNWRYVLQSEQARTPVQRRHGPLLSGPPANDLLILAQEISF